MIAASKESTMHFRVESEHERNMRELLECLTTNAKGPAMLLQLTLTCSTARAIFEEWPRGCITSAMMDLPSDLRQLAGESIVITQNKDDPETARHVFTYEGLSFLVLFRH